MGYSKVMTAVDGIYQLKERLFDTLIVVAVQAAVDDSAKQIAAWAVIEDEIQIIFLFYDIVELDDVRVAGCRLVIGNLSLLEQAIFRVLGLLEQTLHGVMHRGVGRRVDVVSEIDHAVCSSAKDLQKAQTHAS